MAKKIGLITALGGYNYGANLQAYALYTYLNNSGYCCYYIEDFQLNKLGLFYVIGRKIKRILRSLHAIRSKRDEYQGTNRYNRFNSLVKSINRVKIYSLKDYHKMLDSFDVFLAGSDQIWNPYYTNPYLMLNFARNVKKVAYASSIGVTELKEEHKTIYQRYLCDFSHIGVREKAAEFILKEILGREDICTVLDPTFLLPANFWIEFANKAAKDIQIEKNGYIFCYLIGEKEYYKNVVLKLKNMYPLKKIFIVPAAENKDPDIYGQRLEDVGPREFVKLISDAFLVCTDSFHATTISINLQKNFIELMRFDSSDSKNQNSRIYELLEHYNLMDRIIEENTPISEFCSINYSPIIKKLNNDRKKSVSFLKEALK